MILSEYGLFSLVVAAIINKGDTVVEDGVGRDAIVDVSAVNIGDISVAFVSVDVFVVLFIVSGENIDAKFCSLDAVVRIVVFVVFIIVFVALVVVECDVLNNNRLHAHGGGYGVEYDDGGYDGNGYDIDADDDGDCVGNTVVISVVISDGNVDGEVVVDAIVLVATLVSVVIFVGAIVCFVCEVVSVEFSDDTDDVTVIVLILVVLALVVPVVFLFTSRSSNVMSSL